MDEIEYFEQQMFGQDCDGIEVALKRRNLGRNESYLVSFGCKDADLEPEGDTGIKRLSRITEEEIFFIIGGHKTFCPFEFDEDQERYREQMEEQEQQIIGDIGYPGEWTGDDWSIYMGDKEISMKLFFNEETDMVDYDVTADHMITLAKVELADFQVTMRPASEDFEQVHNQLRMD